MKKLLTTTLLLSITLTGNLTHAAPSPLTTTSSITIVIPISISENDPLAFGIVTKPTNGSSNTININPVDGNRSLTGSGNGTLINGGTLQRGNFDIDAENGNNILISINPANITKTQGGTGVSLDNITASYNGNATATDLNINTGGYSVQSVGLATLDIGGNITIDSTAQGNYVFEYQLNVDYQ